MGRFALAALAMCSGCAQILGLDNTTAPADAPPTPRVSVTFQRVSIGAAVIRAPLDLTGQTASWLVPDTGDPSGLRRVPGVLSDTKDTWTADIPDGTPAVEFTMPDLTDPFRRLYAFPSRDMSGLFGAYEHPAPEPAIDTSAFQIMLTLPTAYVSGESFRVYTIGTWGRHTMAGTELPAANTGVSVVGPVNVAYNTTTFPTVGSVPLTKVTMADQVVALRYTGADLTAAAIVPRFDQTAGTDPITATLEAVPHDPLDVQVDPVSPGTRFAAVKPDVATLAMSWSVAAAPGWELANNNGVTLESASVLATDSGAITTPYGNPFTGLGWSSLFTWSTGESRTYTDPTSTLTMKLNAGLYELAEPSAGLTLDLPAGLPVLISINQTPLTTDGMTVTLDPTKAVELSLAADRPTNTYYQWNVYELVPNDPMTPTALTYAIRYAALSDQTTVTIPNDVFEAGKLYTLRGYCVQGGYPMGSTGNFQLRALPISVGYLDSGAFTVQMQ